jgi:hypothetical protein
VTIAELVQDKPEPSGVTEEQPQWKASIPVSKKPATSKTVKKTPKRISNPLKPLAEEAISMCNILNEKNIPVSILQLADLNPSFCSAAKRMLTKLEHIPQVTTETRIKPIMAFKGKRGAPCTLMTVYGPSVTLSEYAILDPGAGENIITVNYLRKTLGFASYNSETFDTVFTIGDGKTVEPLGTVQGIRIAIQGIETDIDAYVLDHCKYNLLLCLDQLSKLRMGVDFETRDWWIPDNDGAAQELEVIYGEESSLMIMFREVAEEHTTDLSMLSLNEVKQLRTSCLNKQHLFIECFEDLDRPSPHLIPFNIDTRDHAPIHERPRRMAKKHAEQLHNRLQELQVGKITKPVVTDRFFQADLFAGFHQVPNSPPKLVRKCVLSHNSAPLSSLV